MLANKNVPPHIDHNSVEITPEMSVNDYVAQSTKMHYGASHNGAMNGGLLQFSRKVGDLALAVVPKNRFWCAVGLTTGGFAGLKVAALITGKNLATHEPVAREKIPRLLQPLHGLLKYDEHSSAPKERWKKVGGRYFYRGQFCGRHGGCLFCLSQFAQT